MTTEPFVVSCYPWLTYAPVFVALRQGFFEVEQLRVVLQRHTDRWSQLIARLDGDSDLILGNAWFALRASVTGRPQAIVAPCGQQCRFVVVAAADRVPAEPFAWADLVGRTVVVPTGIPTPWFALVEALGRQGLATGSVRTLVGYDDDEAFDELLSGRVDYVLTDLDNAQRDSVTEVASLAEVLGPVPWSVFCAAAEAVTADPEPYQRFRSAIGRALAWMDSASAGEVAATLAPDFTTFAPAVLAGAVSRYRALRVWPADVRVPVADLSAWEQALLAGGGLSAASDLAAIAPFDRAE